LGQALLGAAIGDIGLMEGSVAQRPGAAAGVVIAAAGYPDAPQAGARLEGAEPAGAGDDGDVLYFHGGTRRTRDGGWEASGGRVVTVVGRGADLAAARE